MYLDPPPRIQANQVRRRQLAAGADSDLALDGEQLVYRGQGEPFLVRRRGVSVGQLRHTWRQSSPFLDLTDQTSNILGRGSLPRRNLLVVLPRRGWTAPDVPGGFLAEPDYQQGLPPVPLQITRIGCLFVQPPADYVAEYPAVPLPLEVAGFRLKPAGIMLKLGVPEFLFAIRI